MANKKKTTGLTTATRKPLSVGEFGSRMHRLNEQSSYGGSLAVADKARKQWLQLDPIDTHVGQEVSGRHERLAVALGKGLEVLGDVSRKEARTATWHLPRTAAHMALDRSAVQIRSNAAQASLVEADLARVAEKLQEGAHASPESFEAISDKLTVDSMMLHTRSREMLASPMEPWRRQGIETVLKVSLGQLIKSSVEGLGVINERYQRELSAGKDGSGVSGRMVEGMYFTYELMHLYKTEGTLANSYPRFALHREDRPLITPHPRRSYDVVVESPTEESKLYQIKNSSNAVYAEPIVTRHPNKPAGVEVANEAEAVMGWFNDLVDNEATEAVLNSAWRSLSLRFGEQPAA